MRSDCAHLYRDCTRCCALCCVALPHAPEDGFPAPKAPGVPCPHLTEDGRCSRYGELARQGLHGCCSFDCLGAGPAALRRMDGVSWDRAADGGGVLFQVFSQLLLLHQLDWYLHQALDAAQIPRFRARLLELRRENAALRALSVPELLTADLEPHRTRVNSVLRQFVAFHCPRKAPAHGNCVGRRFLGIDLREHDCSAALFQNADLRGCDLTGTSFLGCDLRGADVRGADLSRALFLTQSQINTVRGNTSTLLPPELERPPFWT